MGSMGVDAQMSDNGTHDKAASIEQLAATVTDPLYRQNLEQGQSVNVLSWLLNVGNTIVAPWWSRRRDAQLRILAKQSDFFQGAQYKVGAKLTDVPFNVVPRDPSIKSHRKQAEDYTMALIEGSELGQGWGTFLPKFLNSLWTQDNGAFAEVIGDGDPEGPIRGPALGLKVLDPARCTRTTNPLYPVIYNATSGRRFRFHYTRIIFTSQMPDPSEEMLNIGYCWLSRASNAVQNLIDIGLFKQEKLGSRPQRRMIVGKGVEALEIWDAFRRAELQMDAQGLRRYAKSVVIGGLTKDDSIETIDLVTANDLSDEEVMTDIGVYVLAMTGGFPPRWIWPATTTGATKADAESQHLAGISSGGQVLHDLAYMLGGSDRGTSHNVGRFLPAHLKLVFDYQDDQEDANKANVRLVRAQGWEKNLATGLLNERVAREQMLEAGDLTDSQFEDLELESGRLADGSPIINLFYTSDPVFQSIFGNIDPIQPDLDEVKASLSVAHYVSANPDNVAQKRAADMAVKALTYLLNKAQAEALQEASQEALLNPDKEPEGDGNTEPDDDADEPINKELSTYKMAVTRNAQLLWEGRNTRSQFIGAMQQAIRYQFPEAWAIGAKQCGIQADELTEEEQEALQEQIDINVDRLEDFADYIVENNRSSGQVFGITMSRAKMWINSYERVIELAKSYACADQKMVWILGAAEQHCKDCLRFGGKVYRMSQWNKIGILPKSIQLACHGYRCQCKLVPTTKALSRGRPPKFKEYPIVAIGGINE